MATHNLKNLKHEIIEDLKRVAIHLGRAPTRDEYHREGHGRFSERKLKLAFGGNFSVAIIAAGLQDLKARKKDKKFRYQKERLHGFFVHKLDLKELFKRAGNPKVLKLLCQPDTHVPFEDKDAVSVMLKFMAYYKPDIHMIMGDFIDMEGISHWPSSSTKARRLIPEIKLARKLLAEIIEATPTTSTRIYLEGNHENWLEQAKGAKLPELFDGLEELEPSMEPNLKNLLELDKLKYELFEVNHIVRIGKANFTHGIYTGKSHASKHVDMFKGNMYYGHLHDSQSYNCTSMDGPIEAQSLGCLCQLDAKFLKGKPNNWTHSLGLFEIFPDGTYTVVVPKIIRGKMSYNGKIFKA